MLTYKATFKYGKYMQYPVLVKKQGHEFLVSSRDIPELNAIADSYEDALIQALDAFVTALMIYMIDRKPIPKASELLEDEVMLFVPLQVSVKVALYREMLEQNVSKAELAKRMNWGQKQVDRLWDLGHSTRLDSIEQVFLVLGKRLDICVV